MLSQQLLLPLLQSQALTADHAPQPAPSLAAECVAASGRFGPSLARTFWPVCVQSLARSVERRASHLLCAAER
jgi:hypothetical protein